ncbi:phytase [Litoribacter ruber]|uniref:phytase n=1 Tax=Litoribacter ruber TaxID=702568 RepID=UPI001BD9C458|nr:phytase [Litoribacter ruber]MBT0811288.1 phytase [Litoribacter ruber]
MNSRYLIPVVFLAIPSSCWELTGKSREILPNTVYPKVITEKAVHDTDDPAIWYNLEDPTSSLVIGTDKGENGCLLVYGLDGHIIREKTVKGLNRPNNVDVKQVTINGNSFSIAAITERGENKLRIFSVPDMEPIDQGGIELFKGEEERAPMGVALYIRPRDNAVFAIVSRKLGPSGRYLWQYRLDLDKNGNFVGIKVREFGQFSRKKEIEAIVVDDELGYVYYSDEQFGVRKYFADPELGNEELAVFAQKGFAEDHEGISIYKVSSQTGYILVSDQKAGKFHIFRREGTIRDKHQHNLVKIVQLAAKESDGSEVVSVNLGPSFPNGLFVAMSTDKTFHYYDWRDIAGDDLKLAESLRE